MAGKVCFNEGHKNPISDSITNYTIHEMNYTSYEARIGQVEYQAPCLRFVLTLAHILPWIFGVLCVLRFTSVVFRRLLYLCHPYTRYRESAMLGFLNFILDVAKLWKPFILTYLTPLVIDYFLFILDNHVHDWTGSLHDPNNSYFLHLACLNSDHFNIYHHILTKVITLPFKCLPASTTADRASKGPCPLANTANQRNTRIANSSTPPIPCKNHGKQQPVVQENISTLQSNSPSQLHSTSTRAASVLYFSTLLPVQSLTDSGNSSRPPQYGPKVKSKLTNHMFTKTATGDSDNSGQNRTESNTAAAETTDSPRTTGSSANSQGEGSSDKGGDDDDDDDNNRRKRRQSLRLDLISDADSEKDEETEPDSDDENNGHITVGLACRRLTPTEESLLMSDQPLTPTRHIDKCPIIPGMSDHCTTFRNISSSPLTSVSPANESPSRDIYVHKLMFPQDAADVVLNSIEENIPFTKHGKTHRELTLCGSRFNKKPKSWDMYNATDFKDVPLIIQCMNQLMTQHGINDQPLLNSCMIERCKPGVFIPESTVLPDELLDSILPGTPLAILCLGEQRPFDLIPRSTASSVLGKVTVGRIFADHGSGIFISTRALKHYQLRGEFGPSLVGNSSSSFRMVFYTSASLDDTLQWSDLSPAANESTLTAPTTNPICHRMAQVPYYKTMIDTKLGEKPLTEMLTALNQPIEKGDSKEDKRIRLLALLSNPDTIVPAEVIKKLSSRLLVDDLTAELSALNLSTKGDSKERKARLNDFLSQQTQAHEPLSQGVWDSETHFGYSPPPTQENPSPGRSAPESDGFRFTSPPVSKIDFLKSQQPKTKKTSLGKRKREVTNVSRDRQFNSLQSYIESLNCAKENDLNHDLEYLNLKTSGSAKVKRKRISQFVLNSATTAPSNLENRLEILEKTSLTILDKLDHISKEVDVISLTSSAAGPPTKAPSNSTGNLNALQSDLLDKLTKAYQDNVILLEKTDRSTEELKSTLRETASLHRDLEKWQNSFFKGQDSEKLDEILEIVKHKPATSTLISSVEGKHPPTTTNNTLVARSPQDTRTNQDLPGSNNTSNQARDSYRRPGFTKSKNPAKAKPAKRKRKTPKPLKVALLNY